MGVKIYYFSGTGNSLFLARSIAEKIGAELVSIPKIMNLDRIHIDAESMGIVFPSYIAAVAGLPLMVERFVKKIDNIGSLHIFAVCSCGGYECVNALPSVQKLKQVIRSCGGTLSAAHTIRLPMNNLEYDHIPVPIERDTKTILDRSEKKIENICLRIKKGRGTKYRIPKDLFHWMMTPLYRWMRKPVLDDLKKRALVPLESKLEYFELMPLTDRSIRLDEACTGCGTCTRICPAENIKMVDGRPEFQHRCEMCFACDEWCPSGAIHHWSRAEGIKYRHTDIRLTDMFLRS